MAAAPGAGKTSALRAWAADRSAGDLAWVALDAQVADAAAFDERLTTALGHRGRPSVIVLDDVHLLSDDLASAVLPALLERADARVVLATRVDPDLPLHRLWLDGRLAEIRDDDLAFTTVEAAALLAEQGVELPAADLELLVERTEGWAAGLRLAALLLAGHPEPARAVREFAGDDRAVVAFLVHEVLDRCPEPVREMLVRTSILDRVSGPLADALTGRHDGEETLEDLVRRHAFVEPLDRRRRWYRYHPLFRDLLHAQLLRRGPDAVAEQHRRVARLHARGGEPDQALRHAAVAGDWDLVDRLLRDHGAVLRERGDGALVDEALRQLPAAALRRRPFAATAAAGRALDHGRLRPSRALLAMAEEAAAPLPGDRRRLLTAETALVRAMAAMRAGDLPMVRRSATCVLRATEDGDAPAPVLRAAALVTLGEALVADGDPEAETRLRAAAATARAAQLPALQRRADALRAWDYALAGHPRQATLAAETLVAGDHPGTVGPEAHLAGALAALERGDVVAADAATRAAATALAVDPAPGRVPQLALEVVRATAAVTASAPERQAMLAGLERATEGWSPPGRLGRRALAARARLLALLGRPDEGLAVLTRVRSDPEGDLTAARAAVALDQGEHVTARELAATLAAATGTRRPLAVSALVTEALAADADGDRPAALRALERALDLAEPDGLRLALVGAPDAIRPLYEHGLRMGTSHRALVGDVLALVERGTAPPIVDVVVEELPEPLSEREMAVLRFLPTMLSSQEIAGELFVTLNTVKSHLRSIYRKLDVNGRRAAVERARRLGLLAPALLDPRR